MKKASTFAHFATRTQTNSQYTKIGSCCRTHSIVLRRQGMEKYSIAQTMEDIVFSFKSNFLTYSVE